MVAAVDPVKILVTGAGGLLGRDACDALRERGHDVIATGRQDGLVFLDITDTSACAELMRTTRPDAVLHCAAWTDVDGAERTPDAAYRVNVLGTWNIAAAAAENGAWVAAISSDYVFDGTKKAPYTEADPVNPIGQYAVSKEHAERVVRQILPARHLIVRTSWLFGAHGKNFVRTMLKLGAERHQLPVVADQVGSPTYTRDLARKLAELIEKPLPGTYHACNAGECSWFRFAQEIMQRAALTAEVLPITTSEYAAHFSLPAPRPAYSVLRRRALEMRGMDDMPPWEDALDRFLAEMNG